MNSSTIDYKKIFEIIQAEVPCVLATVLQTHGSTPQKAGSSALIGENGLLAGTVGGGMTELKVIRQSQLFLKTGQSGVFTFDLIGEIAKGSESVCGGKMTILIDGNPRLHLPVFKQLTIDMGNRIPGVFVCSVKSRHPEIMIERTWLTNNQKSALNYSAKPGLTDLVNSMLENPTSKAQLFLQETSTQTNNDLYFLESIIPEPVLIIAGAGHIGQSLVHLGKLLGFKVIVWDHREEFADAARYSEADLVLDGNLDEVFDQLNTDKYTYLVIVTQGHKTDAEVLRRFIKTKLAYIGMIGSKAKVAQMKASFLENKWATAQEWSRIFAPVGLNINALTVDEIGVSIAAQLVQVRNQMDRNG